jgi:hypothetical protein
MARLMTSLLTDCLRAASTASDKRGFYLCYCRWVCRYSQCAAQHLLD